MRIHFNLTFAIFLSIFLLQTHAQLTRIPLQKVPSSSPSTKFLRFQATPNPIKNIANYWSIEYVGLIKLGSEKKEFRVLLDTGSAPLWLPDYNVKNLSAGHNTYNCSESKTCTASPDITKNISYGQGSILGYPIIDDIQIGDIVIPQYNLLLVNVIHKIPNNFYDGIMGLSLGRWQNLSNFPTLLETLKSSGRIKDAMFSMYLGNEPTAVGNMTGELIFGGYDPKYADSEWTFITVDDGNRTQHWMTNMTGLGFGAVNVSDITNIPVIFDSGGSLNVFPQTFLDNIMNQAAKIGFNFTYNNLTNNYYCDCKAQEALPDLLFYFENSTFNLKASSYILSDGIFCYLGFIALKAPIDNVHHCAVLGDVFLKDYYAIYSLDNNTVGLAKAKQFKNEEWNQWKIIIPLAFVVIVGLACVFIQLCKKKEMNTNESVYVRPIEQEEETM